jgi:zinc transport system ATP-binding protein
MTQAIVDVRGLHVVYGGRSVLRGVDLAVHPGEFWFLLGPNGSGKTTLLRAILGLLEPSAGSLERDPEAASADRIGFVPQILALNPSLPTTVREFVSLGFVGTGVDASERRERFAWAIERAGLTGLERADYWSLSGGQRQRALVARALVRRPRLLILDEPTEGLDIRSEESFLLTLDALHRDEGVTLICVTHKLEIAARHATHVALFDDGRLISGLRADMMRGPDMERVFGIRLEAHPELLGADS